MQGYDHEERHYCGKKERPHDDIIRRQEVVLATFLE
jgi:hypothetical protein